LAPQQWRGSRIRFGKRWFNILWLLLLGILLLIIGVAVAQEVCQILAVTAFMVRDPGYTALPVEYSGLPYGSDACIFSTCYSCS
jgi:hypothetical protein